MMGGGGNPCSWGTTYDNISGPRGTTLSLMLTHAVWGDNLLQQKWS